MAGMADDQAQDFQAKLDEILERDREILERLERLEREVLPQDSDEDVGLP